MPLCKSAPTHRSVFSDNIPARVKIMELLKRDKEDVLSSVRIEMERMFGILWNQYNQTEREGYLPMLAEIEARFKVNFQVISEHYLGE